VRELVACGGIAEKNAALLQIYADVTGRPIRVTRSGLASALGAAMLGAVAAGEAGGYRSMGDAAARMGGLKEQTYSPAAAERPAYDGLFAAWKELHDWYGRGGSDIMKRLRRLREKTR